MSTTQEPTPALLPAAKAQHPTPSPSFIELERIGPNAYGMVAVISKRIRSGMLTFAIFREFDRGGVMDRTSFIPEDHGEVYVEFAQIVVERIRKLRQTGAALDKDLRI